jgi:squalene synthase HpnC
LRRYGPESNVRVDPAAAQAYCQRLTASHYENFSVVTWLTPRELRPAFQAIYAFCRWADDLADEVGDPERSRALLAWWRGELAALYRGDVRHPVFVALRPVVAEFTIPPDPFEALIDAFEQDQRVVDYETYDQLLDYCRRSANPVGHLVLYLGRAFDPSNASLSDATCTALQLANFWQDVARDLRIGRIYIPREDRQRFGVTEADLRAERANEPVRDLLAFEVARTRTLFNLGWPLVDRLPGRLGLSVALFTRGGQAILDRIAAQGYDVLRRRPTLSKLDKWKLIVAALGNRRRVGLRRGSDTTGSANRAWAEARG